MNQQACVARRFAAMAVGLLGTFVLCMQPFCRQAHGQAIQELDRLGAIKALIDRGDNAVAKGTVSRTYEFAAFFLRDEDAELKAKVQPLTPKRVFFLETAALDKDFGMPQSIFRGFPYPTPQSDVVNLRMLLDDRIVGDGSYSDGVNTPSRILMFFLKTPLPLDYVRTAYGEPSAQQTNAAGKIMLTYGRFRFMADRPERFPLCFLLQRDSRSCDDGCRDGRSLASTARYQADSGCDLRIAVRGDG